MRPTTLALRELDSAWDAEMTGLLREAAEIREARDRARLIEDTSLAQRETAALLAAIRSRGRPRAEPSVLGRAARRPRGSVGVIA
ncbi:MAG TPA: hypothetical protein VEY67_09245 [Candidatus Dormibacteraeota bacterium]|nr:hypothetical protein [Candidatus Dormibacteraeota bacterium]